MKCGVNYGKIHVCMCGEKQNAMLRTVWKS